MAQEIVPFDAAIAAEPLQSIPMTKTEVSKASRRKIDINYYAQCLAQSSKPVDPTKAASSSSKAHSQKLHSYECDVCGKAFPSHQALGGHKSSHNTNKRSHDEPKNAAKSRKRPHLCTTSSETESASSLLEEAAEGQIASSSKEPYKCDICDKTFPSYQSLGGHKSSHYYEKNNRTDKKSKINGKSHKRPEYLQLFPDNLCSQAAPTSYDGSSSSSCLDDIDLELRL